MPKLDRLPEYDDRSRNYQVRTLLDRMAVARKPFTRRWQTGTTLDQGEEGACVGFSMSHRLSSAPVMQKNISAASAFELYKEARKLDEWPGEDYEGTSVLGGVKAAQAKGYVQEYRWVGAGSGRAIDDVMDAISYIGPVVFGINWMESMFEPRPSGLLEVDTSKIAGGHAICAPALYLHSKLAGEPTPLDLICFQNSWGPSWGVRGGMCYIKAEDLEKLLEMDGEGVVVIKEKRL